MKMDTRGIFEILFGLKMATLGPQRWVEKNHIFLYVVCSRYSSRVKTTSKMVFNVAAMGYPQLNTMFIRHKWLLNQNYDLLINHVEFGPVQYRIGMPLSNCRHFQYGHHIPCT